MRFTRILLGYTILEMLLVLVIIAMIIVLSLRQYQNFRREADILQLQANVAVLFSALSRYYYSNCGDATSPLSSFYAGGSYPVSIKTLVNEGYLSKQDLITSPLVSYTKTAPDGYLLQFNQKHVAGPFPLPLPVRYQTMSPDVGGGTRPIGYIILWQAQVAVLLKNNVGATPAALKESLLADCLSIVSGSVLVTSCASAPANATQFLVWQRNPSFSALKNSPNTWLSNPNRRFFLQMYTTDPITILTDPTQTTTQTQMQYFLCGG